MKRLLMIAAALAIIPGMAHAASVYEQYAAARASLLVDPSVGSSEDFANTYFLKLAEGLSGRWFNIGAFGAVGELSDEKNRDEKIRELCNKNFTQILAVNSRTLEFARMAKLTTVYTSMGGDVYGAYTDAAAVIAFFGLGQAADQPTQANSITYLLASFNGVATIHRPSPDLLVVQKNFKNPEIYGRCVQ